MRQRKRAAPVCVVLAVLGSPRPAFGYRPFDGTDADVAAFGDFELELGPVHWYSQGPNAYLIAPATVLNLGFAPSWELVCDYQNFVAIDGRPGRRAIDCSTRTSF